MSNTAHKVKPFFNSAHEAFTALRTFTFTNATFERQMRATPPEVIDDDARTKIAEELAKRVSHPDHWQKLEDIKYVRTPPEGPTPAPETNPKPDEPDEAPLPGRPYSSAASVWKELNKLQPGADISGIKARLRATPTGVFDDAERAKAAAKLKTITGLPVGDLKKAIKFEKTTDTGNGENEGYTDDSLSMLSKTNRVYAVLQIGNKTRIIQQHGRKNEMAAALEKDAFKTLLENQFLLKYDNNGKPKPENLASAWLQWETRRTYFHADLIPHAPGQPDPCLKTGAFNYWNGYAVEPKKGSWKLLWGHVHDTMCHGDPVWWHWFMTWCSHIVQQPGKKMPSAIGVSGLKGTGKSKFFEWLQKIIGDVHARKINQPHHLVGHFNGLQFGVILLILEEALWSGDKQASNTLKDIVSSDKMEIENKGIDARTVGNFMRCVFISNESWHLPVQGEDERRYFVLEVKPTWARSHGRHMDGIRLFKAIDQEMENGGAGAMLAEMLTWDPVREARELLTGDTLTDAHRSYLKEAIELGWDILRAPPVTEWQHVQGAHGLSIEETFCRDGYRDRGWRDPRNPEMDVALSETDTFDIPVRSLQYHWEEACRRDGSQKKAKDLELLRQTLIKQRMIERDPVPANEFNGEAWTFLPLCEVTAPATWQSSANTRTPDDVRGLAEEFTSLVRAGAALDPLDVLTGADTGMKYVHRKTVEQAWVTFLETKGVKAIPSVVSVGMQTIQKALDAKPDGGRQIHGRWDRSWVYAA